MHSLARVCRDTLQGETPKHGKDSKDCRPQEDHGHNEVNRLPEVWETDAHREARKGPRAGCAGRRLYLVLCVRVLRETLG